MGKARKPNPTSLPLKGETGVQCAMGLKLSSGVGSATLVLFLLGLSLCYPSLSSVPFHWDSVKYSFYLPGGVEAPCLFDRLGAKDPHQAFAEFCDTNDVEPKGFQIDSLVAYVKNEWKHMETRNRPFYDWPTPEDFVERRMYMYVDNSLAKEGGFITQHISVLHSLLMAKVLKVPLVMPHYFSRVSEDVATGLMAPWALDDSLFTPVSFERMVDLPHLETLLNHTVTFVPHDKDELENMHTRQIEYCFEFIELNSTKSEIEVDDAMGFNSDTNSFVMVEKYYVETRNELRISALERASTSYAANGTFAYCNDHISDWLLTSAALARGNIPAILRHEKNSLIIFKEPFTKKFRPVQNDEIDMLHLLLNDIQFGKEIEVYARIMGEILRSLHLSKTYFSLHLRTESDMMKFMKSIRRPLLGNDGVAQAIRHLLQMGDSVTNEQMPALYISSGHDNYDAVRSAFANAGLQVVTKDDFPPELRTAMRDLPYEMRAAVDFLLCRNSDVFFGYSFSYFSKVLALSREMKDLQWHYYNSGFDNLTDVEREILEGKKFFTFNSWLEQTDFS